MSRLLTDAELELMTVLWRQGACTARQVQQALGDGRAYTTVSTLLRILEKKGFVKATREGRTHHYAPLIANDSYQKRKLNHVIDALFRGSPLALVRRLVADEGLSHDDLAALKELVDAELGDAS